MKISEFVNELKRKGIIFHSHGKRHDIYENPSNGKRSEIPRHQSKEIGTGLRQTILKQLGIK
jgi:mRNA interferase HicA